MYITNVRCARIVPLRVFQTEVVFIPHGNPSTSPPPRERPKWNENVFPCYYIETSSSPHTYPTAAIIIPSSARHRTLRTSVALHRNRRFRVLMKLTRLLRCQWRTFCMIIVIWLKLLFDERLTDLYNIIYTTLSIKNTDFRRRRTDYLSVSLHDCMRLKKKPCLLFNIDNFQAIDVKFWINGPHLE